MEENEELYRNFVEDFSSRIFEITDGITYSNIIFLCIGTQRLTGDAFGPLTGTRLTNLFRNANRLNVIGNLNNNISLCNVNEAMNNINSTYTNPFIIAIDAALSSQDNIGKILVTDGAIQLGSSLNRTGIQVGDMSIRGVVRKKYREYKSKYEYTQKCTIRKSY